MKSHSAIQVSSTLSATASEVWKQVSTMRGVNHELMPLVRMTAPAASVSVPFTALPTQRAAFSSWLLLFGILPFDLHRLRLDEVWEGGFHENSTSLVHRVWRHDRSVKAEETGCTVTDVVQFEPRIPLLGYVLLPVVRHIFQHRHRRLKAMFGANSG
jgi:ligand-binding SRPBCC domain-containing protein